ncbi:hypothetical protein BDB00DRAFT_21658 [Zychaea mexicana]|uniref:uncharacterized protein n=1 Tax=Zychaea mexicana TaxID=64656 RepID=UPI0022FEF2F4|nr:uncharacterized protein BDB00DRAFT_21658 [Zychaea mexicana]KAI9497257.1 hypothetical protein BDB00DRAFT_21658 [Zychaea mexicana]
MIDFLPFLPQSQDGVTNELYQIARDAWLFQLATLLDADDDDFMLQITNNESLQKFITAVLDSQLDGNTVLAEILKRVFLVYVRAGRLLEQQSNSSSNSNSAGGPLFTPDQLSSFAVIYGESNPSHVRALFSQLSTTNKKLTAALNETIATLTVCLETVTATTDLERLYVIVRLLQALVAATGSRNNESILDTILKCYNGPLMRKTMEKGSKVYQIKLALLDTWNHIVDAVYMKPLESQNKGGNVDEEIDMFSEKLLQWIEESNIEQPRQGFLDAPLIMDWIVAFSVDETLETLNRKLFNGDDERIEFLRLSTQQILDMNIPVVKETKKRKSKKQAAAPSAAKQQEPPVFDAPALQQQADDIHEVANISQIHDLFPDLGEGFIRACLKHNNNDVEVVIMQLLDNNLPTPLDTMDRTLQELPPSFLSADQQHGEEEMEKLPSILDSRRNIFDNDEFDLLSRRTVAVDKSKMHMGPRDRGTADTMLQDQSFIKSEKQNVLQRIYNMYEDDYDDTYDDLNEMSGPVDLGAVESDYAGDVIKNKNKGPAESIEYEGEPVANNAEHRDSSHRSNRKIPERQAHQKKTENLSDGKQVPVQSKASQGGSDDNSSSKRTQKHPQRSGPEQDQRQRAYKDKNKARFGNHNRKKGHDKKMAKAGVAGPSL